MLMRGNSSKLLTYLHHQSSSSSIFTVNLNTLVLSPQLLSRSLYSSASSSSSSPSDSFKLGFQNLKYDGIRAFSSSSSASAVDLSPLTSALHLARHYTRCYWELSKARLRSILIFSVFNSSFFLSF